MKWTLFLLALVVGLAMALEETATQEYEETATQEYEGTALSRAFGPLSLLIKGTLLGPLLAPLKVLGNVALEVVVTIALILLIAQLIKSLDLKSLLEETGTASAYEYGYGYPPAVGYESYGGPASGGGSSYTSTGHSRDGSHSKRSAYDPSFLNLPVVQRLTARVHEAIEKFSP